MNMFNNPLEPFKGTLHFMCYTGFVGMGEEPWCAWETG